MCGGGTTQTSTVSIPPEVLKNYEEVFARAKQVASKPFVPYSDDPNAFVAGLTPSQEAGLANINALQGMATPDVREGQDLIRGGIQQGTGLQYRSLGTAQRGQDIGESLYGRSLGTSDIGQAEASNIVRQSLADMASSRGLGQAYASDAARNIYAGMGAADPYMREAAGLTRAGLGVGSSYGNLAGEYLGRGTGAVGPGELETSRYMSPYMDSVVRAQQALQAEENAAQRSALTGQAIRAGAFGGDRAGIAQANLARQQSLANQATLSNLLQTGYGQSVQTAQQQQAQELAAAQANRAAQQFGAQQAGTLGQQQFQQSLAAAAQQMGLGQALYGQNIGQGQAIQGLGQQQFQQGLGSAQAQAQFGQNLYQMAAQNAQLQQAAAQGIFGQAAQNAALQQSAGSNIFNYGLQGGQGIANLGLANQQAQLQAAQAQMAAGQQQQQTEQAGKTALYNQFTQQQGFPYQQAQFLGNIAMGTGALSGSTTTTQSSGGGFFSDRRMKENVEDVGKTYNGQKIYRYNYKGDPRTQIGLMADESDKSAVGSYGGYKTVDYKKATDKAAERGHFYAGGLVPSSMGGAVYEPGSYARGGYAEGGYAASDYEKLDNGNYLAPDSSVLTPDQFRSQYGEESVANNEQKKEAEFTGDPRITQLYDKYMFRKPDAVGAQYWQNALESGTPIEEIEKGISESRERQLVNQQPLTYDPSKFARQMPITRNRYGAYAAPEGSYGSSFSPAALEAQKAQEAQATQAAPQASQQATGKGPAPSAQTQRYGAAPTYGYQQPQATGKGPAGGYGGGYGGGYSAPSYGFGGGGYATPDFGYGGGYGAPSYGYAAPSYGMGFGGYGAPSYSGFGGNAGFGGFGGYQNPMSNMMAGYGGGSSGPGMTGFMSGYNQGYGNQMGGYGAMGGMPQASGKGPSSSGSSAPSSASGSGFRNGGRIGYARGGGGHLDPNDLAAIQAQRLAELAPFAAGIPGQTLPGGQSAIPNKLLHVPKLITADVRMPAQKTPYEHAMQMAAFGEKANAAFEDKGFLGKEGFIRRNLSNLTSQSENKPGNAAAGAASGAPAPAPNAANKVASLDGEILPPEVDAELFGSMFAARGGAIHRALGGALPYSSVSGGGGYIPQEVLEEQQIRGLPKNDAELRAAAKQATSQSGGLGQVANLAKGAQGLMKAGEGLGKGVSALLAPAGETAAATGLGTAAAEAAAGGLGAAGAAGAAEAAAGLGAGAMAAGEAAAGLGTLGTIGASIVEALPFLAFLSDKRAKENIEPIGKLYDGQKVYRYNYKGDDRTQIGLMAQEVEKREKRYAGGLVPQRSGYQEGGVPDEDYAIRTIAAEMSGKSPEEARGIAAVIENRLKTGRWGESYRDVVTARNQFEPWNKPEGPNYPMRFAADSPRMQMAREAFTGRGEDPTGGALNFYAPAAQAILAQTRGDRAAVPSWARGRDFSDIGATRFVRDVDAGAPRPPGLIPAGNQTARASTSDAEGDAVSQLASRVASQEATAASRAVDTAKAVAPKEPSKETFVAPKSREGKEQSWSDFLTSRQFIIPALTAIGTMGTTPTRNLGTALSAGLLAGTQSFSDLEKTAEERQLKGREVAATEQRVRTETFTKNMELLDKLRRLAAGYTNRGQAIPTELRGQIEAITKQIAETGAGGQLVAGASTLTPEGRQLPPPATTTTGRVEAKPDDKKAPAEEAKASVPSDPAAPKSEPELPKPGQAPGLPSAAMSSDFLSKIDPDFNPVELMRRSKETADYDAAMSEQLANRALAVQQEMMKTGFAPAIGGGVVPVPGHADEKALQAAAPKLHESFEQQATQYRARQVAKDRLTQIANSLATIRSGKFSVPANEFVAGMRSAGINVPDTEFINPTEAQTIAKNAWKTVFDELKAIGGQPRVLEMQGLQQSGANLELDPGANKNILAGALAAFNYEDKFFEDAVKAYKEQGYRYTDAGFMPEWRKNNRLDAMKEEVYKSLAIRGATPTNSNGTINESKLKEGHTYVIEPGMLPGVTSPTKYRVTKNKDGQPGYERVK